MPWLVCVACECASVCRKGTETENVILCSSAVISLCVCELPATIKFDEKKRKKKKEEEYTMNNN